MCFPRFQIYFVPVTVEKYMNQCMYEMFAAPFSLQLVRSVKARMSEMEERDNDGCPQAVYKCCSRGRNTARPKFECEMPNGSMCGYNLCSVVTS